MESALQNLYEKTIGAFTENIGNTPELTIFAPGRANIIGEHTDYNDGHVLPFAIGLGVCAAVKNRTDRKLILHAENFGEDFACDADAIPQKRSGWASYVVGVFAELEAALGIRLRGKEIAIAGNVPIGSGLSSSAALEIAIATAIERAENLELDDANIVEACRRADRKYVGVNSGPMDQFASRACKAGHAGLLDCRSLEMTHHRIPEGLVFLSIDSGIPRKLTDSAYNERVEACSQAVEVIARRHDGVRALRDVSMEMLEATREELDDRTHARARHVVTEQERVFGAIDCLKKRDFTRLGTLLSEGHRSLSKDYEVSTPLLDSMVEWLEKQPGVLGARLTGAGFGGSLICVAENTSIDIDSLATGFHSEFAGKAPENPAVYKLNVVDGARYRESYS